MDNINEQVPPIANQPSVKTSNNLSFVKALAYGFVIVSIGISIAVGGYLLGTKKSQPPVQNKTSITTSYSSLTPAPIDETVSWKTYVNTQYGFEIKYPINWKATMRGQGETVSAIGNESTFSITDELVEARNISFDIASLGSERLGSYYSSAKNLDDYTNLITKKDEKGNIIRKFVKESTVDNRRALWFAIYEWKVDKQAFVWTPEIYFQDKNNIYHVGPSGTTDPKFLNQILSTLKFTN